MSNGGGEKRKKNRVSPKKGEEKNNGEKVMRFRLS